jgi:3-(3-hydroxy-phenyl)propionate hydroxylase
VKDTPRQDVLPRLEGGLPVGARHHGPRHAVPAAAPGRRRADGRTLRPRLAAGAGDGGLLPGLRTVDLGARREAEGVAANWFARHACTHALVRPDNYVYGVAGSPEDAMVLAREAAAALGLLADQPA